MLVGDGDNRVVMQTAKTWVSDMLLCSNLDGSVLVIINVVFAASLYSIYVYAFYQFFPVCLQMFMVQKLHRLNS